MMAWQGKPHVPTAPREVPPQSEALELFGPGEAPEVKPSVARPGFPLSDPTLAERFALFHSANPWVLTSLERLAADAIGRGRKVGVKALFEILRWQWERATADPSSQFRLNNSMTSHYARLLLARHPEWADASRRESCVRRECAPQGRVGRDSRVTPFQEKAKTLLESQGFVVLRAKSYRQAQERQRCAEAVLHSQVEHNEHTRAWATKAFDSQREAWDRTTYLYGLAASLGASEEQLAGPSITQEGQPSEARTL